MAIIKFEAFSKYCQWAVWEISEDLNGLLRKVELDGEDTQVLGSINNYQKKLEWLASRLTVRYLVEKANLEFKGLRKDKFRKPFLKGHHHHISISHSFPYAVAIIHKKHPVGIDIERPREKILNIAKKFLDRSELEAVGDNIDCLSIYWSAKEVLYKIYGRKKLHFKENLRITPFDINTKNNTTGLIKIDEEEHSFPLYFEKIGQHFIVFNG